MKNKLASLMLVFVMTATLATAAGAAIYNPKTSGQCHDANGKFIPSKECDPDACGCLFHEIEEFIKGFFE
jgi:hypothetical protein